MVEYERSVRSRVVETDLPLDASSFVEVIDNECCDRSEPSEIEGDCSGCRPSDIEKAGGVGISGPRKAFILLQVTSH